MIISVAEVKKYLATALDDSVLEAKLQALELSIRKRTNNNFQNTGIRFSCPIMATKLFLSTPLLKVGDTIQISQSIYSNGIFVIKSIEDGMIVLDKALLDESAVLVTKVEYPMDVVMGAVNIIKWLLKNEAASDGDTSKKEIQSETISRHSVTYVTDSTETDLDEEFGVPKKHIAFLKGYKKARF